MGSEGQGVRAFLTRRRVIRWTAAGLAAALLAGTPAAVLVLSTMAARFGRPAAVPPQAVALVLGAGLLPDGSPSPVLAGRVSTAAELYRLGRVRALLMSGDHSRTDHDEVDAMAGLARRLGVPDSAIVLDHAGFDTFSSCYRARSVFGLRDVVVVSQSWHLPRAVWLCRHLGVRTVGVASPAPASADLAGALREIPAAAKAMLDVWRGRLPQFPGPREHSLDQARAAGPPTPH